MFLDKTVIGLMRALTNFFLCYVFVSISLKRKNIIVQIDSLGNILVAVPGSKEESFRQLSVVSDEIF